MPPKGWKKGSQPAVTGAKSPEPQKTKVAEPKPVTRAKRALAKPVYGTPEPKASPVEVGSNGPTTSDSKVTLLLQMLGALTQAAGTPNLAAGAYTAINEEIENTVNVIGDVRDELFPVIKMSVGQPEISLEPLAETIQKQATPTQQVSPPPPPMPFPAPGFQQGPIPGFVPVAGR